MGLLLFLLILVGVGVVGYVFYQHYVAGDGTDQAQSNSELERVEPGGVLKLEGFGVAGGDLDVVVTGRNRYRQDGFEWVEYTGDAEGETYWVEVEHDDDLEVAVSRAADRIRSVPELLGDRNFDALESGARLQHDGRDYRVIEMGTAELMPDGDGERAERFSFVDLESSDEESALTIENWGSGELRAYPSVAFPAHRVQVLRLKGETDEH